MFPIPWNFPFRKKNGDMSTIGAEIGGAGSELPPHSSSDAGKLLGVKPNGSLEWSDTVNSEIQTLTNNLSDEIATRAMLSAHNLLIYDLVSIKANNTSGTWNNNIYTLSGISFTFNDDGSIDLSGESEARIVLAYARTTNLPWLNNLWGKSLKISGSITNVQLNIWDSTDSAYVVQSSNGSEVEFIAPNKNAHNISCEIVISSDKTVSGTIRPMIRLASDTSTAYAPYAMTNRELTDRIVVHEDTITFNENGKYIFSDSKEIISARVRSTGNYVIVIGNNAGNSAFILYNHEGTNWTRVTSQPQLTVRWVEVIA